MSSFPSPARCKGIPPDTPHSVIFSLPEWEDVIEIAKHNKILIDLLETTYPRFVMHTFVTQVRLVSFFLMFFFISCLACQHSTIGVPIRDWNKVPIISFP